VIIPLLLLLTDLRQLDPDVQLPQTRIAKMINRLLVLVRVTQGKSRVMYNPDNVLTKAIFIVKLISNDTLIQNVAATWNGRWTMLHYPLFSPAYQQLFNAAERYQL
jgi:hypothetical protein